MLFHIIIIAAFSFDCSAQQPNVTLLDKETGYTSQIISDSASTPNINSIKETSKMKFGNHIITKNVSDSALTTTNGLGKIKIAETSRQFVKENQFIDSNKERIKDSLTPNLKPSDLKPTASPNSRSGNASIIIIHTYERVAEKGYKSVELFQKLGNSFYFNEELDKAARWYGELFEMTLDLEPEYYYRYSHSLKAIGENEKANEMLEKFNQLSGNDEGE